MDKFKRGDKVNFKGNETLAPVQGTFVWAILAHMGLNLHVIEHHDGFPREHFFAKPPFPDGFEAIHSSLLKDGLTYAYAKEDDLDFV